MSAPVRLALFALTLVTLFGAGIAAGNLLDADSPGGEAAADSAHGSTEETDEMTSAATHEEESADEHSATDADESGGGHGEQVDQVRGLSATANGFTLDVDDPERARGAEEQLRFRILAEDGSTVDDFDVEHTKRIHVIVVRRDLTGFQHLHPRISADGTWEVPLRLNDSGTYRVFADFSSGGETTTLASDLTVPGEAGATPLPAPAPEAVSDGGYDVGLAEDDAGAGEPAQLEFEVTKNGRPVDVQPYLGADGHLVALREGDLAFLHVHPLEGHGARPGQIAFEATFPTAGSYRLFLQFQVGGEVETVAFTKEVE